MFGAVQKLLQIGSYRVALFHSYVVLVTVFKFSIGHNAVALMFFCCLDYFNII